LISTDADPTCAGTKVYTYTYTDCASVTYSWTYTYTISAPAVMMPANGSSTVACAAAATTPTPPTVTDNCGRTVSGVLTSTDADPTCAGTKVYTYTYTDCASATYSWTYTYTISAPAVMMPANGSSTVACAAAATTPTPPTVTDNCGRTVSGVLTSTDANPSCEGTKVYTYTYTDCASATYSWTYTYTIDDNSAPTASNPAAVTVSCFASVPTVDIAVVTDEADNCSGTPTVTHQAPDVTVSNVISRTYRVADCAGNFTDVVQTITVQDNTAPTITCPANITVNTNTACTATNVSLGTPALADACGTPTAVAKLSGTTVTPSTVFALGANTVTWTVTDASGNSATCAQTVTVQDMQAPVFVSLPASVTVSNTTLGTLSATATDNCTSSPTITFTDGTTVSDPVPTCYSYKYHFTRTWRATDAVNNSATATQLVYVTGVQLTCPANKTFTTKSDGVANNDCATVVKAADGLFPIFTDGCNSSVLRYTMTGATTQSGSGAISGLSLNKGVTMVTYNVAFSVSETCSFTVTVNDNEAPIFPILNNIIVDACDFPTTPFATIPTGVVDNCDGAGVAITSVAVDVTANLNCQSGTTKYTKYITRTWKATDAAGNTATRTQRYYIRDTTTPSVSCKTITVTINASNVTVPASMLNDGSSDNCTSSASLSYAICKSVSGTACTTFASNLSLTPSMIPSGANHVIIPVVIRVTDACGNAAICNTTIRLQRQGTTNKEQMITDPNADPIALDRPGSREDVASDVEAAHGKLKCYPNPFADNLNLAYNLTSDVQNTVVKIYDMQGRLITMIENGEQLAGYYTMNWNLSDLQAGMYNVCLELDGKCTKMERVIVLK
jgi:hypothetical protein